MTHVGPKFRLANVPDVDAYRARRIHDVDAPKIVELGQAWSELGPRPLVKSFSSETVKKPTKLPRISKKKMGRTGAASSSSSDLLGTIDGSSPVSTLGKSVPGDPLLIQDASSTTLGGMQSQQAGFEPSSSSSATLQTMSSPNGTLTTLGPGISSKSLGGASSMGDGGLNNQTQGLPITSEEGVQKETSESKTLNKSSSSRQLPLYGQLVPTKGSEILSSEADLVLTARVDDINLASDTTNGQKPGRRPPPSLTGEEQVSPVHAAVLTSSESALSKPHISKEQTAAEEMLQKQLDRKAVVIGSNLFPDPGKILKELEMSDLGTGGNIDDELEHYDLPDRYEDKHPVEWVLQCRQQTENSEGGTDEEGNSIHAHCVHYEENEWVLKECWVQHYSHENKRYLVELLSGHVKWVKRLCLRFCREDPKKWSERIRTAKLRRQQSLLQTKFFKYIDNIESKQVAGLSKLSKQNFVARGLEFLEPKSFQKNPHSPFFIDTSVEEGTVTMNPNSLAIDNTNPAYSGLQQSKYLCTFIPSLKNLISEIEGVYLWAMKLSIAKERQIIRNGFLDAKIEDSNEFKALLVPFLPAGQQVKIFEKDTSSDKPATPGQTNPGQSIQAITGLPTPLNVSGSPIPGDRNVRMSTRSSSATNLMQALGEEEDALAAQFGEEGFDENDGGKDGPGDPNTKKPVVTVTDLNTGKPVTSEKKSAGVVIVEDGNAKAAAADPVTPVSGGESKDSESPKKKKASIQFDEPIKLKEAKEVKVMIAGGPEDDPDANPNPTMPPNIQSESTITGGQTVQVVKPQDVQSAPSADGETAPAVAEDGAPATTEEGATPAPLPVVEVRMISKDSNFSDSEYYGGGTSISQVQKQLSETDPDVLASAASKARKSLGAALELGAVDMASGVEAVGQFAKNPVSPLARQTLGGKARPTMGGKARATVGGKMLVPGGLGGNMGVPKHLQVGMKDHLQELLDNAPPEQHFEIIMGMRRKQVVHMSKDLVQKREAEVYYGLIEAMPKESLTVQKRIPILKSRSFPKGNDLVRATFDKFRLILDLSLLDVQRGQSIAVLQMGISNSDPSTTALKLKQLKKNQALALTDQITGPRRAADPKKRKIGHQKEILNPNTGEKELNPHIFGTNEQWYDNYVPPSRDKNALDFLSSGAVELDDLVDHLREHRTLVHHILSQDWRDFVVSDAVDRLSSDYNLFVENLEEHLKSSFHPYLHKLDLVLRSQLRVFFQTSLRRWADFFLTFKNASLNILKSRQYYIPDNTQNSGMIQRRKKLEQEKVEMDAERKKLESELKESASKANEGGGGDKAGNKGGKKDGKTAANERSGNKDNKGSNAGSLQGSKEPNKKPGSDQSPSNATGQATGAVAAAATSSVAVSTPGGPNNNNDGTGSKPSSRQNSKSRGMKKSPGGSGGEGSGSGGQGADGGPGSTGEGGNDAAGAGSDDANLDSGNETGGPSDMGTSSKNISSAKFNSKKLTKNWLLNPKDHQGKPLATPFPTQTVMPTPLIVLHVVWNPNPGVSRSDSNDKNDGNLGSGMKKGGIMKGGTSGFAVNNNSGDKDNMGMKSEKLNDPNNINSSGTSNDGKNLNVSGTESSTSAENSGGDGGGLAGANSSSAKKTRKTINSVDDINKLNNTSDGKSIGRVEFQPSLQEVTEKLSALTFECAEIVSSVLAVEFEMLSCANMPPSKLYTVSKDHPQILETVKIVQEVISLLFQIPEREILDRYKEFEYLMDDPKTLDYQNWEEVLAQLQSLESDRNKIDHLTGVIESDFPLFEVHCYEILKVYRTRIDFLTKQILDGLQRDVSKNMNELEADCRVCRQRLLDPVSDELEMSELKKFLPALQRLVINPQLSKLKLLGYQLEVLNEAHFSESELLHPLIERQLEAFHWPLTVQVDRDKRMQDLSKEQLKFQHTLSIEKEQFAKDFARWKSELDFVKFKMDDFEKSKEYDKKITGLREALQDGRRKLDDFRKRETLFNMELSDTEPLEELDEEFSDYLKLWNVAIDFSYSLEEWTTTKFTALNAAEISSSVDMWFKSAFKMSKLFDQQPIQLKVSQDLCAALKHFMQKLPLIEALCHPAIEIRHWNIIFLDNMDLDLDNLPEFADYSMSLKQLEDQNILDHIDIIQEVSAGAQKEYSLRSTLGGMKREWLPVVFDTMPYKETGTYLLRALDDIQTLLDDHILKSQAIRGSPFCRPFERECKDWEAKLLYIQESLDQVLMTQKTWLYLEPIFASEDIVRQMPAEAKKFRSVDERWRETLGTINENPSVLDFAEIENLYSNFVEANNRLDQISKGLNDYLETKRLYFPRFFFLSNDELLSILSETKDPTKVQPHMNKAFEGVAKVRFDKNNDIIQAMVSAEGEVVELLKKINVNEGENKGNVEKWLLEVEHSMMSTLRDITTKSLKDYQQTPRIEWVINWPGQVVICVDMIMWSQLVGESLKNKQVNKALDQINKELGDIVILVRGELTKLARKTLGAMTTIDVHNRDVVQQLVDLNCQDPESFDWLAQMRYEWANPGDITVKMTGKINDKVEVQVKIVNSCLLYYFEYLGNSDRLVITPLTDRCYRTLMGAMDLYYGGAPEGPAGTGKTESVKDLAKALAIQCVVFNCSDGLDFLAMAKFFKGLASSGAWCCFDEFNRINAEVLSVIAQQVLTIQLAIIEKKKRFLFEGTELNLIPTCAVNITMNPGYAGRVELPDSLKALFRPCAMMVPDYSMIGEIFLYSFGFKSAKDLGRKATQALKLSSEQLSPQAHYDFGMRGLKSLLVASGNMKRKYGDKFPEFTLALRGFLDVNLPKFTSADVPLFDGIVSDLFPGVELPPADTELFERTISDVCTEQLGLQPTKYFILKTIQLWETILVRHGLMTVGLPPCGKTSINDALSLMLEKLQDGDVLMPVTKYILNPKSIPKSNLYGCFDENTHEWSDGILAISVRTASMSDDGRRQWLILDGPIDALWIEDMNTVLDDNKKLCLLSGEIIKLSPACNMLFEVSDLAVASPATVSRCGMILMEPEQVSWRPLVKSWLDSLPEHLQSSHEQIYTLFDSHLDMTIDMIRRQKMVLPCDPVSIGLHGWMGVSVARLLESLLNTHAPGPGESADGKPNKVLNAKELEVRVDILFYFALLWTCGGVIDESSRPKFNEFLREIITGGDGGFLTAEQLREKYHLLETRWKHVPTKQALPDTEKGLLYDFYIDEASVKWTPWVSLIKSSMNQIPEGSQFHNIIVPTADTVRNQYIMQISCAKQRRPINVLFCGITGTGKTVSVKNQLLTGFSEDQYASIQFAFSAATTSKQTQDIIDGKLDKRRRGVFGPPIGKTMLVFVDDLNMPTKEEYGAQPPLEILRQFMCQKGWYDRKTNEFRVLEDLLFIGAMGPPGGGKNSIPSRYMWHYNVTYISSYSEESLARIFTAIMKWFFTPFPSSVSQAVPNLVKASTDIYESVSTILRPTPTKSHYSFNLRDLSKIFQGMTLCSKPSLPDAEALAKCWAHECQRIFSDRLINQPDMDAFADLLKEKMEEHFKKKWAATVKLEPLVFVDFLSNKQIYEEVKSHEELIEKTQGLLNDYNAMAKHSMNLVLFLNFVTHVAKIVRVLRLPLGNALCVGVGGSGRKSVATLASSICEYDLFQIEISKSYGMTDWHDDLKRLLIGVGCKQKPNTFLFTDTQVQKESFLEDLSSVLNTGEVPNLYTVEDKTTILDNCAKQAGIEGKIGPAAVFSWYVDQCKRYLHVVLCLSPIGAQFRLRLRNYPSLVNCCTIDWFLNWPQEALQSVANQFLKETFTDEDGVIDNHTYKGVVSLCVYMQNFVYQLTERFRTEIRRHYYVTPTSYLELINCFLQMLGKKKSEVSGGKSRYDVGLEKINTTEQMVGTMQHELEELQPVLEKMTKENAEQMIVIEKSSAEAAITKTAIEKEEKEANIIQESATKMATDCQKDLDEALPALQAAVAALNSLSKGDIVEVKAMKTPPAGVILTSQALCIMFGVEPVKVKDPAGGTKKVDDFWEPAKKKLYGDTNLLQKLIHYDKDNIPEAVMAKVKPFEADPNFDPEVVKKSSVAAAGICKWVRAMIVYERVAREVGPKRAALAQAEAELKEAVDKLNVKKAELKAVLDKLKELEDGLAASKQKQAELNQQVSDCKVRLARAEKLISGLGGEKSRWQASSAKLGEAFINLAGDILIASGMVAYLGVFTMQLRQEAINAWIQELLEVQNIPCTKNYQLSEIIGEPIKIRQWVIDKLPNDSLSIDNAIMMHASKRWPLMIDPQIQANKWVRISYGDELKVLRLTKSDYARHLETCIQFGKPVLIENVVETLDPMLQPLLERAIFKAGSLSMIRLGDNTIEYSKDFKLWITTKLPNPHYAPEICVTVIILNFVTTVEGLTDALLAILVAKESPEMERKRQELVIESAQSKAQLKEIEDKILYLLSASTGNILDDEELITTLANSKVASQRIEERVVVQEKTAREIAEVRTFNEPVAARSAALFFVVSDLANIESNYQYSLEWFVSIYLDSIDAAEKCRGTQRLAALNKAFLYKLYVNICRSLFEKDKLLFSFLTAIKMLGFDHELNQRELTLLLQAGGGGGALRKPKPEGLDWLSEVSWSKILELDKLGEPEGSYPGIPLFKDWSDRFVKNLKGWEKVFESEVPQSANWPEGLNSDRYGDSDDTTTLEQALILLAFRPDGLVMSIQDMVMGKLGKEFLEPPPFDLTVSYQESKPHIPLIFVLTVGADPMSALLKTAETLGMKERIVLLALGQGQGPKADAAISDSVKNGAWVVLQNCHLAESYMPILEATCENFDPVSIHPEFRLWLTGMPSNFFPVSILQNGVKMTVEPPKGLKQNLTRAYLTFDENWLEDCTKPHAFKKMLFGLAFFHSIILERRKFGALGWNIPYSFSDPDRTISASQLKIFLDSYDEIQYKALNYLVAEANYGGRVTDGMDRRTIINILSDYYTPKILEEDYKFSTSGTYYAPPSSYKKDKILEFISNLPITEYPEAFWLHNNADLTAKINEGMAILTTAVNLLPRDSGAGGKSSDEIWTEKADDILSQIPSKPYDLEFIIFKYPVRYDESLNTVLPQECGRFNKLLVKMLETLNNLKKAVKGEVAMTPEIESVGDAFLANKVPPPWEKVSFASLKPLGSYVTDLLKRIDMFNSWVENGPPDLFWVSGFFFTQAFFTGLLQNFARQTKFPIDSCIWNFWVKKESFKVEGKPECGCYIYGLIMEGARWDDDLMAINESKPKVLYSDLPTMEMTPVLNTEDKTPKLIYPSPAYKTSARRGVLSTTGHSTNFIMTVLLPIQEMHSEKFWVRRGVALLSQLND